MIPKKFGGEIFFDKKKTNTCFSSNINIITLYWLYNVMIGILETVQDKLIITIYYK